MNWKRYAIFLAVLVIAFALNAWAQTSTKEDTDRPAPVDLGTSPAGVGMMPLAPSALALAPDAHTKGTFGAPITWPIIPIHTVLLPDGRVLNYGTDQKGKQGAQLVYDVWDPRNGTHTVLPNTTSTDIFCAGQTLMWTGDALIVGGDQTINGVRNFSNNLAETFDPPTKTLSSTFSMQYPRWYPTVVGLPNGQELVLGGREDRNDTPVITPEVFTSNVGWRTLVGATSDQAFGATKDNWYYPRSFVAPNGKVFVLTKDGLMFYVDVTGDGAITQLARRSIASTRFLPSVMFGPGKVLSIRNNKIVEVIDLNTPLPTATRTSDIDQVRFWSNTAVMADGKVLVTGGSAVANALTGVDYTAEIWDPATGQWTAGAIATKPRLYHSTAMLLPDGSVLTGGGGAPGPVNELNAEIYYPPYLYDASGQHAARPTLSNTPFVVRMHLTPQFTATVSDQVSRVTLVHTGAVTHAFDSGQRLLDLGFAQAGQTLTITLPTIDPNVIVPGYYMLFVFNQVGVPSVARIVQVLG